MATATQTETFQNAIRSPSSCVGSTGERADELNLVLKLTLSILAQVETGDEGQHMMQRNAAGCP